MANTTDYTLSVVEDNGGLTVLGVWSIDDDKPNEIHWMLVLAHMAYTAKRPTSGIVTTQLRSETGVTHSYAVNFARARARAPRAVKKTPVRRSKAA